MPMLKKMLMLSCHDRIRRVEGLEGEKERSRSIEGYKNRSKKGQKDRKIKGFIKNLMPKMTFLWTLFV